MIRTAKESDLEEILKLGEEFGHLMEYQKTAEGLREHLGNILVYDNGGVIEAYYHCQEITGSETHRWIVETKVFPGILAHLLKARWEMYHSVRERVAVCMQGAGHREHFRGFIQRYQEIYHELWCWTSIKSIGRTDSYHQLGFSFNPKIQYTFPNPHKGGEESTYQLGIWEKSETEKVH